MESQDSKNPDSQQFKEVSKFAAHHIIKAIGALCGSLAIQSLFAGRLPFEDVLLLGIIGVFLMSLGSELSRRKIHVIRETEKGILLEGISRDNLLSIEMS